ncbi:MAG: hypothetical protein PHP23_08140 [Desulfobacterales bacterium]|nr:hypothetical protein [Desulfobacterales bacterium]MDD4073277.1 hypothetical protein [Desulfobacterales bacterium]MDD4391484.1 hypothetical protein [Desulfobacterales bacterium]
MELYRGMKKVIGTDLFICRLTGQRVACHQPAVLPAGLTAAVLSTANEQIRFHTRRMIAYL